jgi:hypothetical protein
MKSFHFFNLFIVFISYQIYAQTTHEQYLIDMEIYPYYSIRSEIDYLDDSLINCKTILLEDINNNFSNIKDLDWLQKISKDKKAVLIGENHFNQYIQNLRNRILFALNTVDYYPIIIFEEPYSYAPFVNYYLHLQDENQANVFYAENLNDIITTKEEYDLLKHIRRWNKLHQDKIIKVGFSDVEKTQDELSVTINQIIVPYFQKLNPRYAPDWKAVLSGNFESLINEFKQNLEKAKKNNIIGKYVFITPQYISNVIENLESSNNTLYKDYFYYRQKAILRNLTDSKFLGDYLQNGKIIIHSGSHHLRTHIESDSVNNLWEGSYLSNVYEYTKGKTYSIKVEGIARSFGESAHINSTYTEPALGFNGLFEKMQKAYKAGLIKADECYFVSIYNQKLTDYYKFWIQKGRDSDGQGLLIESASWDKAIELINTNDPKMVESFISNIDDNKFFDKVVIIPCSPLITPIMKKNSSGIRESDN